MKAFIFGTFNPVTIAHIQMGIMAENVLGKNCLIVYVPTSDDYICRWKKYKEGSILPGNIRADLLKDAISKYGFVVSPVEIMGVTDGRTYNTIKHYGFKDSYLCLGMDNIAAMKKWYKWEELLQKVKLLVFKRDDQILEESDEVNEILSYSCGYQIIDLPGCDGISSTKVRECYKEKEMDKLKQLVPANVYEYLEENENVFF